MDNICDIINIFKSVVQDGDVVNIANHPSIWELDTWIGCWGIKTAQKNLFDNPIQTHQQNFKLNPTDDTHSMVYFHDGTFSVEPPRATFLQVEDYIKDDISIYRYNWKLLNKKDINMMRGIATNMINISYDYGQLIDIAINQILGYPGHQEVKLFDGGNKKRVCSAGAGVIYQATRINNEWPTPRLFSVLDENYWNKDFIKQFKDEYQSNWYVEYTYPAMFGLAETHFNSEFQLVLKMKDGKVEYLRN